ncbi:MAG: CBS domain-containing protein [Bdellovibrio sp.]|nr:CBS domain-containing protein [Bdellovibrio sp.]
MATLARDIMTNKIMMIPVGQSLADAMDLMTEKRIRHLPVVDVDSRIVGILSLKDFSNVEDLENQKVEVYMSKPIEWVDHDIPLRSAIMRMLEKKISALLVADQKHELVGIVTTDDLLWLLAQSLEKSDEKHSLSTILDIESLDEIAHQIAQTGI